MAHHHLRPRPTATLRWRGPGLCSPSRPFESVATCASSPIFPASPNICSKTSAARRLCVSRTAKSCTGGLVAGAITDIAGCSDASIVASSTSPTPPRRRCSASLDSTFSSAMARSAPRRRGPWRPARSSALSPISPSRSPELPALAGQRGKPRRARPFRLPAQRLRRRSCRAPLRPRDAPGDKRGLGPAGAGAR